MCGNTGTFGERWEGQGGRDTARGRRALTDFSPFQELFFVCFFFFQTCTCVTFKKTFFQRKKIVVMSILIAKRLCSFQFL